MIIKPAVGGNLLIQDRAGGAVLSTGTSGATIPTITGDVTITGDLIPSTPLSHRNFFINGGFDVWQRGTSLAGATKFLADRWLNGTTETQSRQTFTPGQTDVTGSPIYYHRGGGGSTEWYDLKQRIENVGVLSGQEVTLSYWMKGSSTFTNAPYLGQNFGPSGSSQVNGALATHGVTTSWVRYSQTFTIPSISGKTVNANPATTYTMITLFRANVTNNTVDIANCQLELGSNATPFEHRSYGEELANCQRYCLVMDHNGRCFPGRCYSGATVDASIPAFPVEMRAAPTCVQQGTVDIYNVFESDGTYVDPTINPFINSIHLTIDTVKVVSIIFLNNNPTSTVGKVAIIKYIK